MPRTTAKDVEDLLGEDYNGCTKLRPFIDTANMMVSRIVACALTKGITYSASEAELLERWLAAHCYAMNDKQLVEKETADSRGKFGGNTGFGLDFTSYGQQAKLLDYSQCLVDISSRKVVLDCFWAGKYPSEQIDYDLKD